MQVECGVVFRVQSNGDGLESLVERLNARILDRMEARLFGYGPVVGDDVRIILAVGSEFDMIQQQRPSIIFGRVPFGCLACPSDSLANVRIGDMDATGGAGIASDAPPVAHGDAVGAVGVADFVDLLTHIVVLEYAVGEFNDFAVVHVCVGRVVGVERIGDDGPSPVREEKFSVFVRDGRTGQNHVVVHAGFRGELSAFRRSCRLACPIPSINHDGSFP